MKSIFVFLLFSLGLLFFPSQTFAAGEFSSSYNVRYIVDEDGLTQVNEEVTLKNNTDKFFPSSFSLIISATNLENVEARDVDGLLETVVEKQDRKSQITVKFTKQIGGKGKEYSFDLNFTSKDFVQKNGEVRQISVPKIGSVEDVDTYLLSLSVPVSYGDPSFITPEPKSQAESGGRLLYSFNKEQLSESGVLSIFGTDQTFDFALQYKLENNSILPEVKSIGLPSKSVFQQILIHNIEPKPDQVSIDGDGNYRAFFKLNRRETLPITVHGLAKVKVVADKLFTPLSRAQRADLLASQSYWDSGNPLIKGKVAELLNEEDKSNAQKIKKLYKYVVKSLYFDYARLEQNNFERLGSLTTISNPKQSLSQEYTDLLIALARAAGVPTRQVVGVVFSNNLELRPLSFNGKNLHAWVEYYDEEGSWKAVDPTWESTSGGVDYFSQSLINHLAVVKRGVSSNDPVVPTDAVITFTDQKLEEKEDIQVFLEVEDTLYSGFPQKAKLRVENKGNISFPKGILTLSSQRIQFVQKDQKGQNQLTIPIAEIPPFGNTEMIFDIKTNSVTDLYKDYLLVGFAEQVYFKEVAVKPFYHSPLLLFITGGVTTLIFAFYILVLGLHLRIGHKGIQFVHSKKKS